jgi:hypothetical protein
MCIDWTSRIAVWGDSLVPFRSVPPFASGDLDTKTKARPPPGPLQGVTWKSAGSRVSNKRQDNSQETQDFAMCIPPTLTSSGSGVSRRDAISVDEDKHEDDNGTDQHDGHRHNFGVPTGLGNGEAEELLPQLSSFWNSLQAPIPALHSLNPASAETENNPVFCATMEPLSFPVAPTTSNASASSSSCPMVPSTHSPSTSSAPMRSSPEASFTAQVGDSWPVTWRSEYTNMLQLMQGTSALPPSVSYTHFQSPSAPLNAPLIRSIAEPLHSRQEHFNAMSELGYPSPEADVSGEVLVHSPNLPSISHEQNISGRLRQHQYNGLGRCASCSHRPEELTSLSDIETPMSMSDADGGGVPHDDFMENFGAPEGDGISEEVGLEGLGVEFLKRCVSTMLFVFYSTRFYDFLFFMMRALFISPL